MATLALPLVILSICLAIGVVLLRHFWLAFDTRLTSLSCAISVLIIAIWVYFRAKKHFESKSEILVRLESQMNLYSSLSAAEAGKTSWPEFSEEQKTGISWNYSRLLLPCVGSLSLLLAAFIIPVQAATPSLAATAPRAWENLAADLDELKEQGHIQNQYIEEVEKKLEELKNQPDKDWYSHPSLEATENLRQYHKRELEQLTANLNRAEKSLSMLKEQSGNMKEAQRGRSIEQFNNAMKMMQKGLMKPDKELLEQLKNIDPKMLNSLNPEQMQQLRERMKNMSDALKKQLREGLQPGEQLPDDNEHLDPG